MRKVIGIAVVIGLFVVGLWVRSAWEHDRGRAEAFLKAFELYCVLNEAGQFEKPGPGYIQLMSPNEEIWADPRYLILVRYPDVRSQPRLGCRVDDVLRPMNSREQGILDTLVAQRVASLFPELLVEESDLSETWDQFSMWMLGKRDTQDRWGVVYSRHSQNGSHNETTLAFSPPRR